MYLCRIRKIVDNTFLLLLACYAIIRLLFSIKDKKDQRVPHLLSLQLLQKIDTNSISSFDKIDSLDSNKFQALKLTSNTYPEIGNSRTKAINYGQQFEMNRYIHRDAKLHECAGPTMSTLNLLIAPWSWGARNRSACKLRNKLG